MRSSMLAPGLLFPASPGSIRASSAESPVRLSAIHHLFAVRVERLVNNPLGRIDFVVVPEIKMAKPFRDGLQPRALRLLPQRVIGIRAIHDLPEQHECRIPRQIVLLQNRLEGTFLAICLNLDSTRRLSFASLHSSCSRASQFPAEDFVSDWKFAQKDASQKLPLLHSYSMKNHQNGSDVCLSSP